MLSLCSLLPRLPRQCHITFSMAWRCSHYYHHPPPFTPLTLSHIMLKACWAILRQNHWICPKFTQKFQDLGLGRLEGWRKNPTIDTKAVALPVINHLKPSDFHKTAHTSLKTLPGPRGFREQTLGCGNKSHIYLVRQPFWAAEMFLFFYVILTPSGNCESFSGSDLED